MKTTTLLTPFYVKNAYITNEDVTKEFYTKIVEWLWENHQINADVAPALGNDCTWHTLNKWNDGIKKEFIELSDGKYLLFSPEPCFTIEGEHIGFYQLTIQVIDVNDPIRNDPRWEYQNYHYEWSQGHSGKVLENLDKAAIPFYLQGWDEYINSLGYDYAYREYDDFYASRLDDWKREKDKYSN